MVRAEGRMSWNAFTLILVMRKAGCVSKTEEEERRDPTFLDEDAGTGR
jgi:hypothetical protein